MTRKDPLTGESFTPKRSDQKFATRKNQIQFNNEKAKKVRQSTSKMNALLQKNFRLLTEIMAGKKNQTFHKQFLLGKGISLAAHTHVENWEGSPRYAVYEYILIVLEQDQIQIVTK